MDMANSSQTLLIEIYCLFLPKWFKHTEQLSALLNAEEQIRANRFRFAKDRSSFTICRGWLRLLAAHRLKRPVTEVSFTYGSKGKPSLSGDISFSLSHSANWAVIAFAESGQIGIDIEPYRNYSNALKMATRFFTPTEISLLRNISNLERDRRFFDLWTRKEALIKATGEGLSIPLNRFVVGLDLDRVEYPDGKSWGLCSLSLIDGYSMALCASKKIRWNNLDIPNLL